MQTKTSPFLRLNICWHFVTFTHVLDSERACDFEYLRRLDERIKVYRLVALVTEKPAVSDVAIVLRETPPSKDVVKLQSLVLELPSAALAPAKSLSVENPLRDTRLLLRESAWLKYIPRLSTSHSSSRQIDVQSEDAEMTEEIAFPRRLGIITPPNYIFTHFLSF